MRFLLCALAIAAASCAVAPAPADSTDESLLAEPVPLEDVPPVKASPPIAPVATLRGVVTTARVRAGSLQLHAGQIDGTQLGHEYWLFQDQFCVGAVSVTEVGLRTSTCHVRTKGTTLDDRVTYVAVRGRVVAHVRDTLPSGPSRMPNGRHPFGPWDQDPQASARNYDSGKVAAFVGKVERHPDPRRVLVKPLWGSTPRERLELLNGQGMARPSVAYDGHADGLMIFLHTAMEWELPDQTLTEAFPQGSLVVAYSDSLFLHGDPISTVGERSADYAWEAPIALLPASSGRDFAVDEPRLQVGFKLDVGVAEFYCGRATVLAVSGNRAMCRLTDPHEPDVVLRGDERVGSLFWHPTEAQYAALHGSFDDEERRFATELLERYGCIIQAAADRKTDVVVLGRALLQDEHYHQARSEYRFATIPIHRLREYQ